MKKKLKNQIRLKFKGLFLSSYKIWYHAQNFSSINRNSPELDNFEKILKNFKIWKNLNALIDFGQIQYQSSLMDVIYLCVVLGR